MLILLQLLTLISFTSHAQCDFSTDYLKMHINGKGFITSMKNITVKPGRELVSNDKPSPLLCLYDGKKKIYYQPRRAVYNSTNKIITLNYSNGSVAKVSLVPEKKYFKLTLKSL